MLAKCTDGEVTITKSGGGSTTPAPEQRSSVSDLRMMRRSDLKRTLSSDVRTNSNQNTSNNNKNTISEGEGGGESEIETKRAHLSGGEEGEEMVTEQFEQDLTEAMEGEEDDRERLVRDFVESATRSSSDTGSTVAKLKREIHVLSELAHAKELEWNSILRLKKLKEEMCERLSRKMRVEAMYNTNKRRPSTSSSPSLSSASSTQNKVSSSSFKTSSSSHTPHPHPSVSPNVNVAHLTPVPPSVSPSLKNQRLILPKPTAQLTAQSPLPSPNAEIILSEGRQGRIKDVQTIIADYRSKNPANEGLQTPVPKIRGRRSSTNSSRGSSHSSGSGSGSAPSHQSGLEASRYSNPSLLSMANLALGSGATVRQPPQTPQSVVQQQQQALDVQLNYLGNVQVQRQGASQVKSQSMPLPPVAQPTFPEVTLHPVLPSPTQQQNSLLHGILTKTNNGKQASPQQSQPQAATLPPTFSPPPPSLPPSHACSQLPNEIEAEEVTIVVPADSTTFLQRSRVLQRVRI
ncbi:hypothetical protein WDU94_003005 [Cyamophila willieti]